MAKMVEKVRITNLRFHNEHILKSIKFISETYTDINIFYHLWNSLNDNQTESKEWLISYVTDYIENTEDIKRPNVLVLAGWFGLTGFLLKQKVVCDVTIIDKDENCALIGSQLYPSLIHITKDIINFNPRNYDIIICTACEHLTDEQVNTVLSKKLKSTVVFLQSNNYNNIEGHINCKTSVDAFASSLKLKNYKKFTLELERYDRYMVIGA